MDTAIILAYKNIISNSEKSCFDSGVKPNRNVLPLNYKEAWYAEGKYSNNPKLYPCDMDCDYQEEVKEKFPYYEDQQIEDGRFEKVEGYLDIKNINDVVVIVGTDSLLDCVEINVTGKQIISGKLNDNDTIYKNIYGHVEIDPDKKYIIRATEEPFAYSEGCEYKIKSMREA